MLPFARALATVPTIPREWLQALERLGPDDRVPIERANEMLMIAIASTGDPLLPVKAGRRMTRGDAGALDYLMSSSSTVRDAFEAAGRYVRLINEAMDLQLAIEGNRAFLKMQNSIIVPPEIEDFGLSSFFCNCVQPVLGDLHGVEVHFLRAAPADTREHAITFGAATLRFSAPWSGFAFDADRLSLPVTTADPTLNQILRAHLERNLAERPNVHSLIERARHLIRRELPHGRATAPLIARELAMSRRTLCRRLEEEHTTFSDLLDDVRRTLAIEHVVQGTMALSEIAFLLGFAQTAGFHRAFKRWTTLTPSEYRARHR